MAGRSSRGNPSLADIVRSVGVLGVGVLAIFLVAQVFTVTPERATDGEDLGQVVSSSRPAVTAFDLLAPTSLPDRWIVTSARPAPETWDLNVLTADDEYIGLQQAVATEADLLDGRDATFTEVGPTQSGGQEWTEWEASGQLALTRSEGDVATLVIGSAPREEIDAYVGSLSDGSS